MTQPTSDPDDVDMEAPEADVAEQHAEVVPDADADSPPRTPQLPLDADPADVSEQEREVGYDEDDYR